MIEQPFNELKWCGNASHYTYDPLKSTFSEALKRAPDP